MDNRVEALEFHVKETGPVTGIPLLELQLKSNLLVCCIVRGKQIITPSGRDTIELGDTVIVVTTNKGLQDISDILEESWLITKGIFSKVTIRSFCKTSCSTVLSKRFV